MKHIYTVNSQHTISWVAQVVQIEEFLLRLAGIQGLPNPGKGVSHGCKILMSLQIQDGVISLA